MDPKINQALYVAPHRRNYNSNTFPNNEPQRTHKEIRPSLFRGHTVSQSSENAPKNNLKYTQHALTRMEERKITTERIKCNIEGGDVLQNNESNTYIDETTQTITGKNGYIITTLDNKRNTQFDILNVTDRREKALLREALYRNNSHAMCELGELYLNGSLGKQNVQAAYEWLLKGADRGNSHAMCLLAQMYQERNSGDNDLQQADEWMQKAAQRGNKYALAVLGQKYLSKYLSARSNPKMNELQKEAIITQAVDFLERSASKGSTRAIWHLGKIYQEGYSKEPNLSKAIEYYVKAAEQGSPASLESLNNLVTKGLFDIEALDRILDKASKLVARTSSDIAVDLGFKQIMGHLGKNPERGLYMLEQAADKRNVDALHKLIKYYQDGKGCTPDAERAHYWFNRLKALYEEAADKGNVDALWDLGHLYLKGNLEDKDLEKAEKFFIKVADTGNPEAAYLLGMHYKKGSLGPLNVEKSVYWIQKSIEIKSSKALQGDLRAAIDIGNIYLRGDLATKDYAQALQWFEIANNKRNIRALNALAETYSELGVYKKSVRYYEEILALQKDDHKTKPINIAETLTDLGWYTCRYLGEYEKAKTYHIRAFSIYDSLKELSSVANQCNNLGHVHINLGEFTKAEKAYTMGLNLYKKIYRGKNINIAESLNGLGDIFRIKGQFEHAQKYYEEALEFCRSLEQEQHEYVVESLKGLGKLFQAQENFSEAIEYYKKALSISETITGKEHPDTAMVLELLEELYSKLGKVSLAKFYQEQVLKIYQKMVIFNIDT